MKTLLDCPTEILRSILECLPAANLRVFCLVSQDLRKVAEPVLYASVELIQDKAQTPPIISLLQGIQRRPQLAKYVHYLAFFAIGFYDSDALSISVDSSELASLIAIIQDINPPFQDLWIQELGNGTMDAFVTLLLSLAPNVTRLRLTGVCVGNNRLLSMMPRASLCQTVDCKLPRLQYLREVDFDPHFDLR